MESLLTLPPRIASKIEPEPMSGCWLWTAAVNREGYGVVRWPRKMARAHRAIYEILVGPIPKPTLNHECRVRCCVNPAHLTPMTLAENTMEPKSLSPSKLNSERMACPKHGIPYSHREERDRWRRCGACITEKNRAYKAKWRASHGAGYISPCRRQPSREAN